MRSLPLLASAVALQLCAVPAHGYTIWYSTLEADVSGSGLTVSRGSGGLNILTSGSTPYSIVVGLDVPSNVSVTSVQFCYHMSFPLVQYIQHVRLAEVGNPTYLVDMNVNLSSVAPVCPSFPIASAVPGAPFALVVNVFSGGSTQLTLTAVGLDVQPVSLSVGDTQGPDKLTLSQSFPNPTSLQTAIEYDAPPGERVRLEIHDAGGRLIRTLDAGIQTGRRRVVWDGCDRSGRRVPPGVYFYRVVTARATSEARRLTVLR